MLWKKAVICLKIESVGQVESGAQVEGVLCRVAGRSILVGEKPGCVTTGTGGWGDVVGAWVDVWFLSASGSKVMAESEDGRRWEERESPEQFSGRVGGRHMERRQ